MKQEKTKRQFSLRLRLVSTILACWVVPIVIVVALAGMLLSSNYEQSMRQKLDSGAENAMGQLEMRMAAIFEGSKAISYDGVVRNAFRAYQQDGDSAALYGTVNDYLSQNFSRDEKLKAVFISFLDVDVYPYTIGRGTTASNSMLRDYRQNTEPKLLESMRDVDTGIFLFEQGGELYVARNLLDVHFKPYATVIMLCDSQVLFQSLDGLSRLGRVELSMDETLLLSADEGIMELKQSQGPPEGHVQVEMSTDGHDFVLAVSIPDFSLWREMPGIKTAVLLACLLALPMLLLVILLFYRHVSHPVETLVDAASKVQKGERGYMIEEIPRNTEFQKLYSHFNDMSSELKSQFDRSYQEQQALQQAKIKALQSQINPHFLNNTLEVINWEARIAGNERVSAMIEALSVMLDAALDRNDRGLIQLREELSYVDAYLYIIKERLGERLKIEKSIDETMLEEVIPRLILQPIVENAVEHDISARRGGTLCLRAYRDKACMVLEVEHDGSMSDEDRQSIRRLLAGGGQREKGQVGLCNVQERLGLLYGSLGRLSIEETDRATILARVEFPAQLGQNTKLPKDEQ